MSGKLLRDLFVLDDGTRVVVEDEVKNVERRARILRTCALLIRAQCDSYERRMPPLQDRTNRDLEAFSKFQAEAAAHTCRLVTRLDEITPGGIMREWGDAVSAVGALSYDAVIAELLTLPVAP